MSENLEETATAYDRASQRISDTPELEPYRDTILADWPEGDAHYEWAATCELEELFDWARDAAGDAPNLRVTLARAWLDSILP